LEKIVWISKKHGQVYNATITKLHIVCASEPKGLLLAKPWKAGHKNLPMQQLPNCTLYGQVSLKGCCWQSHGKQATKIGQVDYTQKVDTPLL